MFKHLIKYQCPSCRMDVQLESYNSLCPMCGYPFDDSLNREILPEKK